MKKLFITLGLATLLFSTNNLVAQDVNEKDQKIMLENLDSYIKEVVAKWQLPGLSTTFSIDGKVVFSKGYGTKELRPEDGKGLSGSLASDRGVKSGGFPGVVNTPNSPIDGNTLFQIGSTSKSFTATVIADLIDEGKIKWTDTVSNILPDFKMYDPWVTENMQIQDVMTHKSGLKEQSGTYIPNLGYTRDDVYKMLARIKPAYSFRGDYQYNNITFIIAEKIIEKVTGKSWEENVRERIFKPLKMDRSTMNGDGFATATNVATPHNYSFENGKIETLPLYGDEQALHWLTVVGPAGSIVSSTNDMAKYAQMHSNKGWLAVPNDNGGVDTVRIMSKAAMEKLHEGVTITSQTDSRTTLYAPCWFVEQNNQYRLYFHTGTTWGMTALCFYVPELNFSGAILVNSEAGSLPRYAIMNRGIDLMIAERAGKDFSDPATIAALADKNTSSFNSWYKSAKESDDKDIAKRKEVAEQIAKGLKVLAPAPKAKVLVGDYVKDELFGNAKITLEDGELYIAIGKMGFKNKLKHVEGNRFSVRSDGHTFPVNFTLDAKGKKATGFEVEFRYGEEKDFDGWIRK